MTDVKLTPAREQEIRTLDLLELMSDRAAPVISGHLAVLLAEVDRLRKALSDAGDQVAELEDEVGKASAHTHFLERNTLPDLNRQIEHHKDGKARWRKRAETAEARVAELTITPANEAVEMAEAEADLEAMRREHRAPCRVPDSPDCTCPPEAWGTPAPRAVKRARPRNPRTCSRCGDTPAQWCPDCEACRLGCFATRAANPCTHPNAPWNTEPTP
ncbi:hypothetical protein [Streptomyces griseus]|uniref:hypothetical protein n=1 Tax=Streptomyces griseus TaxID=1911 RepID=UPI0036F4BA47